MRKLQIDHLTEYQFATDVTLLPHRLLIRPRESHSLRIASSTLAIVPAQTIAWQRDALDNSVAVVSFTTPSRSLRIESQVVIEHYDEAPLDFRVEEYAASYPFVYAAEEAALLAPLRSPAWPSDRAIVEQWLRDLALGSSKLETFALLDQLNRAICRDFRYQAREEAGVQSPASTLAGKSGSCRDFAALLLDACRHLGLASRFVSGYHTSHANDAGPGSTHAWAEVYLPGPGWKGFDPTAGVVTGSEHIAVAVARHPEAVPPVTGSYLGPKEPRPNMHVAVRVFAV
jgi:transglutaminase-like putative cysteine protease